MDKTGAFAIGALCFLIAVVFVVQAFFPGLMHVQFPKLLWIAVLIIGGVLGVVVKQWLQEPWSMKRLMQTQSRRPDKATLRKNKDKIVADLQSQDANIRTEAMTSLAVLKDLDSVALLIPGLRDADRMVRLRASEALAWVTGQGFGEDEGKWTEWWARNKPAQPAPPPDGEPAGGGFAVRWRHTVSPLSTTNGVEQHEYYSRRKNEQNK
ncbi:MAG: hypothetical protein NTX88_11565 [Candidatus Atribacteria bacterium]|nr:hypothetical protein [Candidatus Atribacteria bacterium]